MSSELQWLRDQRNTPAEPRWAKNTLPPRCPSELIVTDHGTLQVFGGLKWVSRKWHWKTRSKADVIHDAAIEAMKIIMCGETRERGKMMDKAETTQ